MRRPPLALATVVLAAALVGALRGAASASCPAYGPPSGIVDVPASGTVSVTFDVPRNGTISSIRVAGLHLTYPSIGDLEIHLVSPAGTDVTIVDRVCAGSADLSVDLDDAAASPIPCPPTDGLAHTPSNPLSAFLGEQAVGTWTIRFVDHGVGSTNSSLQAHVEICTDCTDTPRAFDFDTGSGTAHCYDEAGLRVCAFQIIHPDFGFPAAVELGDNDGDGSPDLANSTISNGTLVYFFTLGGSFAGAPFAVNGFDFTQFSGTHTFQSDRGGTFTVTTSGHVTPPASGWSGITQFTWTVSGGGSPAGVMDNLTIVAQCCGDGILDPGEQCEQHGSANPECCTGTCQFQPSDTSCTADGNVCTADVCDGAGLCGHPDKPPPCALVPACGGPQPPPPPGPPIESPKVAKKFIADLVQAFVACLTPTTAGEGGVGACAPPRTPNERAGSPANGWRWAATGSQGQVTMAPVCPGAGDLAVTLKLTGVVDGGGAPTSGRGTLELGTRLTVSDPVGGNMTTIDYPLEFGFTLTDGKANVTTTVDAMLSDRGLGPLPNGTSVELVAPDFVLDEADGLGIKILDANGNLFAVPGIFLP